MKKVKNRRKQDRVTWEGTVSFHRSVLHRRNQLRSITGEGQLQNLSGSGICLVTDERLSPKQFLTITVPIQNPGLSIPTLAYVQWTRPLRGRGQYAAGLSFLV